MNEPIINGIDVSESVLTATNNDVYYSQKVVDELQNNIKRLQEENEGLKENQCCPETCEYIATEIIRYTNVCEVNSKYKQALENIKQFLIFADHSNTGNKYFENVEKALNIANEVLNDRD